MKTVIQRSVNGYGYKCKTYVHADEHAIAFCKFTLVTGEYKEIIGMDELIREGVGYKLYYQCFSIKQKSLFEILLALRQ